MTRLLINAVGFALTVLLNVQLALADPAPKVFIPPFGPDARGAAPPTSSRPAPNPHLVYTTVPTCRVFNTVTKGGLIAGNDRRTFTVAGTTGFQDQGGTSTGCGIPAAATAVTLTLTTSNTAGNGSLVVYPATVNHANLRAFSTLQGKSVTSETVATLGAGGAVTVLASGAATNVDGSVTGYFAPPIAGMIASDGSIYSGGARIISATVINPGVYRVTVDSDVSYCTPMVNVYSGKGVYGSAYGFAGHDIYVYTWYISGTTHLEVSNSYYFYLTVVCG